MIPFYLLNLSLPLSNSLGLRFVLVVIIHD